MPLCLITVGARLSWVKQPPKGRTQPPSCCQRCSCLEITGAGCCFSEGSSDCLKEGINYLLKLEAGLWLGCLRKCKQAEPSTESDGKRRVSSNEETTKHMRRRIGNKGSQDRVSKVLWERKEYLVIRPEIGASGHQLCRMDCGDVAEDWDTGVEQAVGAGQRDTGRGGIN